MDAAERKRSIEELRQSEAHLRAFIENAPVPLAMFDRDLCFIAVSKQYIDTFKAPADLVGRCAYEVFPEIPERWKQLHKRALGGESVSADEDLFLRSDLRAQWVKWKIDPWFERDGNVGGILLAAEDVTEQVEARSKLRESEERLELLMASAQIGTWDWDIANNKLVASDLWYQIFGIPRIAEMDYNARLRTVHPDDRDLVDRVVKGAIETREPYSVEFRTLWPDGSVHWVSSRGKVFCDSSGQPVRMRGAAIDITKLKKVEEALREQTARSEFVAEASDVGFWFCDLPFDKLIWDKRVKTHFWLPHDAEVSIETFYDRLHPEDRERTQQAIAKSIADHTQYDIEYRTMSGHGEYKWIRAIGRTFYDQWDVPKRFDGITLDITERKKVDDALRASETRYRELADSLERQVQARTIELQESNAEAVRISQGFRELSRHVLRVRDEERRKLARELHDSAGQLLTALDLELSSLEVESQRGNAVTSQQLGASKDLVQQLQREIRTTSYLLHPPLLDEAGLVSALSWYVQGLNQRSALQTELDIGQDFGRLPRDIELVVFRLVQESLTNIHRHSGSKTAFIRVTRDDASIRIEIRDEGKGIPAGKLRDIQTGGSGVGVQGMRERLRQYDGRLLIESDEAGTRVVAAIPIPNALDHEDLASEPLRAVI